MSRNDGRIESEQEVEAYIQKLRYALSKGASITIVRNRNVDRGRDIRHTNRFTIADLFPDDNPVTALKRELGTLTVEDYIRTVNDDRYPDWSELREFGKRYGNSDVYIKMRVELIGQYGGTDILVLSFHYAEFEFDDNTFPYKRGSEEV